MADILANGDFGRDDGVKCDECGGKTFLVDDQGGGLCSYECENCDNTFGVQYDSDDEDAYEPEGWELAHFDDIGSPV
jgi:hypothetical protein